MSQAYSIPNRSLMLQALSWVGVALGLLGYCATGPILGAHRPVYAMTPEQLTTWVAALCSAAVAVVNTVFVIYHRFQGHKPRKPRKRKPDAPTPARAS